MSRPLIIYIVLALTVSTKATVVFGQSDTETPSVFDEQNNESQAQLPQSGNTPARTGFDEAIWKEVVGATDYSENSGRSKKRANRDGSVDETSSTRMKDNADDDDDASVNLPSLPIDSWWLNIIVYVIAGGLILYILYMVLINLRGSKGRKKESPSQVFDGDDTIEDIRELDVDPLLREALASGNYRLAIRICFLGMLKKLDEGGKIRWKKDKTNRDYLGELFNANYHFDDVRRLTLDYERIWYGEHELSSERYLAIISSFGEVETKFKSSSVA